MMRYIPDELFIDIENKNAIFQILESVTDCCVRMGDEITLDDAVNEIKALGETKIADFLLN